MQVGGIKTTARAQVEVCTHKKTGDYVIVQFAPHKQWPSACVVFGKLIKMSADEFEREGLCAVIRSLEEFPTRNSGEIGDLDLMEAAVRERFIAEHQFVMITVEEENGLILQPMKRSQRGTLGTSNAMGMRVEFPFDTAEFNAALDSALMNAD